MILPHGGELVNGLVTNTKARQRLIQAAARMPALTLQPDQWSAVENIASGLFSPLTGFMSEADYNSVVETMHLADGTVWTLPIVLAVSEAAAEPLRPGQPAALYLDGDQTACAVLELAEQYTVAKKQEADYVYGTRDPAHPGVQALYNREPVLLAGRVQLLSAGQQTQFHTYRLTPAETRAEMARRDWKTTAAFQTRNPIHRAHEYLQKCALEMVDGLFISPLVGRTKAGDVQPELVIRTYETILAKYYPPERTLMAVFPVPMSYAGPREAVFHALCRKNYGCTHFIVGRDHAGVGSFYGPLDAQRIFDHFTPESLGIVPLKFDPAFYCQTCGSMATGKTCPHDSTVHIALSGTRVRELLASGTYPPPEMTRPEVAQILIAGMAESN